MKSTSPNTSSAAVGLVKEDATVYAAGGGGLARQEHETEFLSQIIELLNETYGLNLTDDDRVDIERIKIKLEANDELRDVLTGDNILDAMRYTFNQVMAALILDFVHKRIDLYRKLTEPDTNMMFKQKWFEEFCLKYHGERRLFPKMFREKA